MIATVLTAAQYEDSMLGASVAFLLLAFTVVAWMVWDWRRTARKAGYVETDIHRAIRRVESQTQTSHASTDRGLDAGELGIGASVSGDASPFAAQGAGDLASSTRRPVRHAPRVVRGSDDSGYVGTQLVKKAPQKVNGKRPSL